MCLNCKYGEIKNENTVLCRKGKSKPKTVMNENGLTKNYRHCDNWSKEKINQFEKELIKLGIIYVQE